MTKEKARELLDMAFVIWKMYEQGEYHDVVEEMSGIIFQAAKDEISKEATAFRIATNAIYFDDSSDYKSALYEIIESIRPGFNPVKMPFFENDAEVISVLFENRNISNDKKKTCLCGNEATINGAWCETCFPPTH